MAGGSRRRPAGPLERLSPALRAGGCWAGFTILLRLWQLGAIAATAVASVLSAVVVVPGVLLFGTFDRLAALPTETLILQIVVHGVMAGVLAMVAYARSVALLGVGSAALFPAVVPAVALIMGIPLRCWPQRVWRWHSVAFRGYAAQVPDLHLAKK